MSASALQMFKVTRVIISLAHGVRDRCAQEGKKPEADWWDIAIVQLEAWLPALRQAADCESVSEFRVKKEMVEDFDKVMRGLAIRSDLKRIQQNLPKLMEVFGYPDHEITATVEHAIKRQRGRARDEQSLEALEMNLGGKTHLKIAKHQGPLVDSFTQTGTTAKERGKDRVKKSLKRLRPLYDDVVKKYSEK